MDLIVITAGVSIECLYYGNHYKNLVLGKIILNPGTLLEIKDEGKYIPKKGWFILVTINGKETFVLMNDIERNIEEKFMKWLLDVELEKIFLKYQIEKSLKEHNAALFYKSTSKLRAITNITSKIKTSMFDKHSSMFNNIL